MAELIATGRTPALLEPFRLDRFARDHADGRPGLDGDALMLRARRAPTAAIRPIEEFAFGGELPHRARTGSPIRWQRDVDYVWMHDNVEGRDDASAGSTQAGCRRWLTIDRNTSLSGIVPTE